FIVKKGDVLVKIDPAYFRPTEVDLLIGDPTKAQTKLGWKPKYDLKMLVEDMVISDVGIFKRDILLMKGGHKVLNQQE
ncbi:MAG: GDP-mannose 4,6-dehydratase, partial [Cyclobacteriaceae bacterium]